MDVGVYPYPHADPLLIDKIVNEFLSQGKFDKLRKECMSDADTKPAYQNLQQRVETTVTQFLKKQVWKPDLNKNQLRDSLRKHILESGFFDAGINRIVDQVVNQNVLATVFLPEVEEVVYNYLSIPRPVEKTPKKGISSVSQDSNKSSVADDFEKRFEYSNNGNSKEKLISAREQVSNVINEDKLKNAVENNSDNSSEAAKTEIPQEFQSREAGNETAQSIKTEDALEIKYEDVKTEENVQSDIQGSFAKMELVSDESQESLSRIGVEKLRIHEAESMPVPDSDDSVPLEINEKTLSDSQDSDDSIMNQMSPISQGRLTPDIIQEIKEIKEDPTEEKVEVKEEKDKDKVEEKRPLTFIGRIPKLKREDSESSKSPRAKEDIQKKDKLDVKNVYSSDESDSTRSFERSDSDDRKWKDRKKEDKKPPKLEKKHREDSGKSKKHDDHHKSSTDRSKERKNRDEKTRDSKDCKRSGSRDRHSNKKSSSSSSSSNTKDKGSSYHKNSHESHHKNSNSKVNRHEKKKKEDEKKKSKNIDDHSKERNKKEDRRSTDRDSNERERDKTSGGRTQGESKKREKEEKTEENKGQKSQKEGENTETEVEKVSEPEEVVEMQDQCIKMKGIPFNQNVTIFENEGQKIETIMTENEEEKVNESTNNTFTGIPKETLITESPVGTSHSELDENVLDFNELYLDGALTKYEFPAHPDDFYVKFNSTGFKYFEEWEQNKLDCEEEFKEFVDEAERNLDLISDDESISENEFTFEDENQKTVENSMEGLGNFTNCLMFDPITMEFYRWTNNKYYQKYRKKNGATQDTENNESDESKENIDRNKLDFEDSESHEDKNKENQEREKKTLYLKLLNRYKRKVMRTGMQKRRLRKSKKVSTSVGIKEKNDNQNTSVPASRSHESESGFLFREVSDSENRLLASTLSGKIMIENTTNMLESGNNFREFETDIPNISEECERNLMVTKPSKNIPEALIISKTKKANDGGGLTPGSEAETEFVNNEKFNGRFFQNDLDGKLGHIFTPIPESLDVRAPPESPDLKKKNKRMKVENGKRQTMTKPSLPPSLDFKNDSLKTISFITHKFSLPLSPDSDDVNSTSSGGTVKESTNNKRKTIHKEELIEGATPKKQVKRSYHQKYESQDLYKPRPVLNTTRTRKRDKEIDTGVNGVDSPISRVNGH